LEITYKIFYFVAKLGRSKPGQEATNKLYERPEGALPHRPMSKSGRIEGVRYLLLQQATSSIALFPKEFEYTENDLHRCSY